MLRKFLYTLVIVVLAVGLPSSAFAQDAAPPAVPAEDASGLAIPDGSEIFVAPELATASGEVQVVVRLKDNPVSLAVGEGAKQVGPRLTVRQQQALKDTLNQKQSDLIAQIEALGGRQIGRLQIVLNAVIISIDASQLTAVSKLTNVSSVRPLGNYELDLSETVPYIGASYAQDTLGYDGTGVRVAVLDSGIDYTHYNLGGSGDVNEYLANDPSIIEVGTFPTNKVVGGYDFVGDLWPTYGDLTPDSDPLDSGPEGGHGTHVADIIAGHSADGLHKGVAPGASLYAVKVCSSVSTSCSGVALLEGMEYALDPNGDGNIDDAVDVINMSLGSSYGQIQDDLSFASANATMMGVVVVASAGNSADRPYILGSPSSTPEVISVAQTNVPSAMTFPLVINSPAAIAGVYANTATVDFAPIGAGITGDVVYVGTACPGDTLLADPAGKIALIDRGVCAVSLKTDVVGSAGAIGALIGLVADGDAVSFSYGGGTNMVPTLVIIRSYANLIKVSLNAGNVVNVSVTPDAAIPLAGSIVGSSSRGPNYSFTQVKPDIGAPGASMSAEYGTGAGETAFGGTSGAAPMVSGAAALVIQAQPRLKPKEVKSLLVTTAETEIYTNPATLPGVLAPITRIGGGEVRVDRAIQTTTVAYAADWTPNLSFGYHSIINTGLKKLQTSFSLRNYSKTTRTYTLTPTFRYADDEASGAVQLLVPHTVTVRAKGYETVPVTMIIDPTKLPIWSLDGGPNGGNGPLLQTVEFDGYLNITDGVDNIHMPWHVLPHRSAEVMHKGKSGFAFGSDGTATVTLRNMRGAIAGQVDVFSLLGESPAIPESELPGPGDNFAIIDLKYAGARLVSIGGGQYGIQFAINTYGSRTHPAYPGEFDIYIDSDRDGNDDFVIYNAENGGFGATGQTIVNVYNLATGTQAAYFYADADLQSSNMIMTAPLAALGLTPDTQFDFSVYAFDNYFTGALTDAIEGMTYTAGYPRYFGYGLPPTGVAAQGENDLTIESIPGGELASPSQTGLLLLYRDAPVSLEVSTLIDRTNYK